MHQRNARRFLDCLEEVQRDEQAYIGYKNELGKQEAKCKTSQKQISEMWDNNNQVVDAKSFRCHQQDVATFRADNDINDDNNDSNDSNRGNFYLPSDCAHQNLIKHTTNASTQIFVNYLKQQAAGIGSLFTSI